MYRTAALVYLSFQKAVMGGALKLIKTCIHLFRKDKLYSWRNNGNISFFTHCFLKQKLDTASNIFVMLFPGGYDMQLYRV